MKPTPSSINETAVILRKTVIIAIFAAVAVVLSIVESLIPVNFSVPGAKLGLANIMVLTCLYFLRGRDALMLIFLKTVLTAMIFGTFSSFLFSLFGAVFSFAVMYGLLRISGKRLSLIGISIAGGVAHNIGQLTAASFIFKTSSIFYYLPVLLLTGIATGILIGIAVRYLVPSLSKLALFADFSKKHAEAA